MENQVQSILISWANHCAPLILRLKPATMLMIPHNEVFEYERLARFHQLCYVRLYESATKYAMLFYDWDYLCMHLQQDTNRSLLHSMGYANTSLEVMFSTLSTRIQAYYERTGEYPHEIGIFLGYPYDDVRAFMKSGAEKVLYRGYWNVYDNVECAKYMFQTYDRVRSVFLDRTMHGFVLSACNLSDEVL